MRGSLPAHARALFLSVMAAIWPKATLGGVAAHELLPRAGVRWFKHILRAMRAFATHRGNAAADLGSAMAEVLGGVRLRDDAQHGPRGRGEAQHMEGV
jgi:hypothetical protein